MEAMERLMHGRTTLMIGHRLSTLANCDARLEVEEGRVVKFEQPVLAAGAAKSAPSRRIGPGSFDEY